MLRVIVDLLPGGNPARTEKLSVLEIVNESGLAPVSDYSVRLDGRHIGCVRGHRRTDGKWPLIARAAELARGA